MLEYKNNKKNLITNQTKTKDQHCSALSSTVNALGLGDLGKGAWRDTKSYINKGNEFATQVIQLAKQSTTQSSIPDNKRITNAKARLSPFQFQANFSRELFKL